MLRTLNLVVGGLGQLWARWLTRWSSSGQVAQRCAGRRSRLSVPFVHRPAGQSVGLVIHRSRSDVHGRAQRATALALCATRKRSAQAKGRREGAGETQSKGQEQNRLGSSCAAPAYVEACPVGHDGCASSPALKVLAGSQPADRGSALLPVCMLYVLIYNIQANQVGWLVGLNTAQRTQARLAQTTQVRAEDSRLKCEHRRAVRDK